MNNIPSKDLERYGNARAWALTSRPDVSGPASLT
jgi:hypothetical protein